MKDRFYNIEQLIEKDNISRRELAKFNDIVQNYQPDNGALLSILTQYTYRNIDAKTKVMFDKTIDALFKSLDYPTEEWEMDDPKMLINYNLVKDSIIEYCITDLKNISTIVDNVAFLNNMPLSHVKRNMQSYMSSYGDTSKIMNAFSQYSDDYQTNIKKANLPEGYIPVYSKAVISKIKEIEYKMKKEYREELENDKKWYK